MKIIKLAIVLALATPANSVLAQSGGMKSMDMQGMEMKGMDMKGMGTDKKPQGTSHRGVGVVKKTNPAKSAVTLAHDPIKTLDWPAMTMDFTVKDKALFDRLQAGKKVEFEVVQQGKDYVITAVK